MPQVDFYLLHGCVGAARNRFICRLLEKVWHQGQQVYLLTRSDTETRQFDNLLWTFRLDSFVPHEVWQFAPYSSVPIQIGHHPEKCPSLPVLLNMTANVPPFFKQFDRILEVVEDSETARSVARNRYRLYRDAGHMLLTHEIRQGLAQ